MHLSKTLAIIINGKDGKPEWREVSQKYLPKGGRTLNLPLKTLAGMHIGVFTAFYFWVQWDYNPNSIYSRIIRYCSEHVQDFDKRDIDPRYEL